MSAHPPGPALRRPLQFTLLSIFVLTTLSAIFLSAYFAGPGWLKGICLVFMVTALPVSLTVALIHGRGYLRTFCVGGLFPSGLAAFFCSYVAIMYFAASDLLDSEELMMWLLYAIGVPGGLTLAAGALAMTVRWIVEGPRASPESSSPPAEIAISNAHAQPLAGPHFHCATCGQIPANGRLLCSTCHETDLGS